MDGRKSHSLAVQMWHAHIKVVAEAESEQPPEIQIACPQCGDTQVVYADNIISVSEDKSAINPETPT